MNERTREKQPPQAGLSPDDIYFVIFRRKWLILAGSALGILAAGILHFVLPTIYVSHAKIAVPYVLETGPLPSAGKGSTDVKSTDSGGDTIMTSEMEIIKSWDLAQMVAASIGPEKILAKDGGGTNLIAAASQVAGGVGVERPRFSMIIDISFRHPDPQIVQPVLKALIEKYQEKHAEIHRPDQYNEWLSTQTDTLRASQQRTAEALRQARTNAGVTSVEDAKKNLNLEISRIRSEIDSAQAELAQRQAVLAAMKIVALPPSDTNSANAGAPSEKLGEYRQIRRRLESLQGREDDLSIRWADDNPVLQGVRQQIDDLRKQKEKLEAQYPDLANLNLPTSGSRPSTIDPQAEMIQIQALSAKTNFLTARLQTVQGEAARLEEASVGIEELERNKALAESSYRAYEAKLQEMRAYAAFGSGRMSSIRPTQEPSPPKIDASKKPKIVLMVLAAGILGSFALAFVLELYLDRRIKRPCDVESKVRLPLFLVIPDASKNGRGRLLSKNPEPSPSPAEGGLDVSEVALAPLSSSDGLKPHYEALRDRLMFYFHARNMTHKPKLVGITSCSRAAGATTIAAGLAAALSETGEGNVLLVDMNRPGGAAHPFYKGKPGCGLQELLENGKRGDALVQENLYLATSVQASGKKGGLLPNRFSDMMPKLKASDYDFIIFDMPPVSQTSATSNLAGMLDMTFLVLESEKTNQEAAKRAASMFAESQASVAAVLNKSRTYLPSWLHQEI